MYVHFSAIQLSNANYFAGVHICGVQQQVVLIIFGTQWTVGLGYGAQSFLSDCFVSGRLSIGAGLMDPRVHRPSCRHRGGDVGSGGGGGNQVIILRPTIIRGTETDSALSGSTLIVHDRHWHKTVNRRIPFVFDQKPIIVI